MPPSALARLSKPGLLSYLMKVSTSVPGLTRELISLPLVRFPPANLDLESPWSFKLRNPKSAALDTHAGVLEFIAEEGVVYLPPWVSSEPGRGEEAIR